MKKYSLKGKKNGSSLKITSNYEKWQIFLLIISYDIRYRDTRD